MPWCVALLDCAKGLLIKLFGAIHPALSGIAGEFQGHIGDLYIAGVTEQTEPVKFSQLEKKLNY